MSEHEELHDRAEREVDKLEQRSQELGANVDRARQDWESKKSDESVPGARPEDDSAQDERADEQGPPQEADITPGD